MKWARPQDTTPVEITAHPDASHTHEDPYCTTPGCWCHTDVSYHALVTDPSLGEVPESDWYERALAFLTG